VPRHALPSEQIPVSDPVHFCDATPVSDRVSEDEATTTPVTVDQQTELVLHHLGLADAIARRFRGRGEDDDDLRQVARCALVEAAGRYDPDRGPFAAFAGPTVSGVLKRHFRDHGWMVRPPRPVQQLVVRVNQQWSDVAQETGAVPTVEELASSLGEPADQIMEARCASMGYRATSIEVDGVPVAATAVEDPEFQRCEARVLVAQAWALLDESERQLLQMRFWENRSQSDIAQRIGTSQMQVSRLLTRALGRLHLLLEEDPAQDPTAAAADAACFAPGHLRGEPSGSSLRAGHRHLLTA
jgi:RNA polymerase sigma-B factor